MSLKLRGTVSNLSVRERFDLWKERENKKSDAFASKSLRLTSKRIVDIDNFSGHDGRNGPILTSIDNYNIVTKFESSAEYASTYNTTDINGSFPIRGVKLSYFKTFINQNGGEGSFKDLTTTDVSLKYLLPLTLDFKLSLCDQLALDSSNDVGPAEWYISHVWNNNFLEVVESVTSSLQALYGEYGANEVFVWFDLFSISQYDASIKNSIWFEEILLNVIKTVGNLMLVMQPLNNPVPLTRSWCLFELLACQQTKCRFEISMTSSQRENFFSAISRDSKGFYNLLENIDSQKSNAFKLDERESIFSAISNLLSGGFHQLDSILFQMLEKWMIDAIMNEVKQAKNLNDEYSITIWQQALANVYYDRNRFDLARPLLENNLEIREKSFGHIHIGTLTSMHYLARNYYSLDLFDLAEPLFVECMDGRTQLLGEDDLATLTTAGSLAILYLKKGKLSLAEKLCLKCYNFRLQKQGRDHNDTIMVAQNLALIYTRQCKYNLAEELHKTNYELRKLKLGIDHPDTLVSVESLASVYAKQDKYDLAEPMYEAAVESRIRTLGESHLNTVLSISNLAYCRLELTKYPDAELLYRKAYELRKKHLGSNHERTIHSLQGLGDAYKKQRKFDEAESAYKTCLEFFKETSGETNVDTLDVKFSLAELYSDSERFELAEPLIRHIYDYRLAHDGLSNTETLEALGLLIIAYYNQDKVAETKQILTEVELKAFSDVFGPDNPVTTDITELYKQLLDSN